MLKEFMKVGKKKEGSEELPLNRLEEMKEMLTEVERMETGKLPELRGYIESLILTQDENGFWGLIPNPNVDGDVRVDFWYMPTYINTAIMMKYLLNDSEGAHSMPGFIETFKKALMASTLRKFSGHGFEHLAGLIDAMETMKKGAVIRFVNNYSEWCPEFTVLVKNCLKFLKSLVEQNQAKDAWGRDYTNEIESLLKGMVDTHDKFVFVYGTLMRNNSNHQRFMGNAKFVDKVTAQGYALFDLGPYPAVVEAKGEEVKGELYFVDVNTLRGLHQLENEGYLYNFKKTIVTLRNERIEDVGIYVYNHPVNIEQKIEMKEQPWNRNLR